MAKAKPQVERVEVPPKEAGAGASTPVKVLGIKDLWQGPALLVGGALLVAGLAVAMRPRQDYDMAAALKAVEAAVEADQHDTALALLNGEVGAHLGDATVTTADQQKFHLLVGDALYAGQRSHGESHEENNARIRESYETYERLGGHLDPLRVARVGEVNLALGKRDEALGRAHQIPDEHRAIKRDLLKRIADAALHAEAGAPAADHGSAPGHGHGAQGEHAGAPSLQRNLEILTEIATDPSATEHERLWAAAKQAELRLEAGFPEVAIDHLLKELNRVEHLTTPEAGELFLLLGRAYFEIGDGNEAERQLARAEIAIAPGDPARAEIQCLLGRIAAMRGQPEEARERFTTAIEEFAEGPHSIGAHLGLAEAEAALGSIERTHAAYDKIVELVHRDGPPKAVVHAVGESVRERAVDLQTAGRPEEALRFAGIVERLYDPEPPPLWELLITAECHRAIGQRLVQGVTSEEGGIEWERVDAVTRAEIRERFAKAAERFHQHAKGIVAESDDAYAMSLWNAAECYDRSGEHDLAIVAFSEYATGRPADPRRYGARFRLAQAHQARGDYPIAADIYRSLIADDPSSGERNRSYVPLVECLLSDGDAENDPEAERILVTLLNGQIPPEAPDYRHALESLGSLYYRSGRYPQAIERLTESLSRFPIGRQSEGVRLILADALRLSAAEISDALEQAMPQTQRSELQILREMRLREALALYKHICAEAGERDERHMIERERIALRNAFFYRADCAFDLGQTDLAIEFYDAAANRYADDPASLVAMMQIVNAYTRMGRWAEATTANERARQRFRELPEEAFNRPDLPMGRRHWEQWLDSAAALAVRDEQTHVPAEH